MRLSDILGAEVFDESGRKLGRAHDVRMIQDGPMVSDVMASLRVVGIVVSPHSLGSRLGIDRGRVRGPWLLKFLVNRLQRKTSVVDWDNVRSVADNRIVVAAGEPADRTS
jgi:sporulation protein YlmC with PRC-barrel domain